jgi:hypothetical protein
MLVDLDIVQLLVRCETKGIQLLNCPKSVNGSRGKAAEQTAEMKNNRYACEFEVRKENL